MADPENGDNAAAAMGAIPKLGPDSGIFVPVSTTGAFGGVVESHNVVAQKLVEFQNQQEALRQGLEATNATVKDWAVKDEERRAAEALKAEQEKKELDERLSGFKAFIEEKSASIEEQFTQKCTTFTEQLDSQYKSLHHSVEELSSRQAELVSRILPNWESEIKLQVTSLSKDLEVHKHSCESSFQSLREDLEKTRAAFLEQLQVLDTNLSGNISTAQGRIDGAEAKLQELTAELSSVGSRSSNRDAELAAEIASSAQRVEAFAIEQGERTILRIGEEYGTRMDRLESVMRQHDYERLHFQDQATKDLAELHKDLEALNTECSSRITQESAKLTADLDQRLNDVKGHLATALQDVEKNFQSQGQQIAALAESLQAAEVRMQAADGALRGRIEAEAKRLEQFANAEAALAIDTIRADEGVRLSNAETMLKEAELQRRQLGARLGEEAEERKQEIESSSAATERRVAAIELTSTARFESVRSAMDELAEEFQGYVHAESTRAVEASRLEALVRALEERVWPWRHASKGRDRSQSPGRPGLGGHVSAWQDGKETTSNPSDWRYWQSASPKKPGGPKPFYSARSRFPQPAEKPVEETSNSLSTGLTGSPVGPGLSAARATRSSQASTGTMEPEHEQDKS